MKNIMLIEDDNPGMENGRAQHGKVGVCERKTMGIGSALVELMDVCEKNNVQILNSTADSFLFDPYIYEMRNITSMYGTPAMPKSNAQVLSEHGIHSNRQMHLEYLAVQAKQSKLPSNVRKIIIREYERLLEKHSRQNK